MASVVTIAVPAGWIYTVIALIALGSILLGVYLVRSPRRAVEKQIELYRVINWRMEPVSWEREICNTRVMGWIAVATGISALTLVAWQCAILCGR